MGNAHADGALSEFRAVGLLGERALAVEISFGCNNLAGTGRCFDRGGHPHSREGARPFPKQLTQIKRKVGETREILPAIEDKADHMRNEIRDALGNIETLLSLS